MSGVDVRVFPRGGISIIIKMYRTYTTFIPATIVKDKSATQIYNWIVSHTWQDRKLEALDRYRETIIDEIENESVRLRFVDIESIVRR